MRKLKITQVTPGAPGTASFEVNGDVTDIFHGKYLRAENGNVLPGFTTPVPAGYSVIQATTFRVIENEKYEGEYVTFSQANGQSPLPSTFANGKTIIRVQTPIDALAAGDPISYGTDGYITNISTYLIEVPEGNIVVPPRVSITRGGIETLGRNSVGWAEVFNQNFVDLARNFAGPSAPDDPFVGQTYFDTDNNTLQVWNGTTWAVANYAAFGSTFKFTQSSASSTWVIDHYLDLDYPFLAFTQFFIDRGQGPKPIIPLDVSFVSKDRMVVTFSNPEIGYALIRP